MPDIIKCQTLAALYNVSVDDLLYFNRGETLVVLGDENPDSFRIALVPSSYFLQFADRIKEFGKAEEE